MTGVIPTIIGFYVNSNLIVLVGACLMAGAIGDFTMYKELRKYPERFTWLKMIQSNLNICICKIKQPIRISGSAV